MSYVLAPHNTFKNKASGWWNPTPSNWRYLKVGQLRNVVSTNGDDPNSGNSQAQFWHLSAAHTATSISWPHCYSPTDSVCSTAARNKPCTPPPCPKFHDILIFDPPHTLWPVPYSPFPQVMQSGNVYSRQICTSHKGRMFSTNSAA